MSAFNFQRRFASIVANGLKTQTIRRLRKDGCKPCEVGLPFDGWLIRWRQINLEYQIPF